MLIIVGILGAFAIEDWQEQQKQKKVVDETIDITFAELSTNRCDLIKAHQHQHQDEVRVILRALKTAQTDQQIDDIYQAIFSIGIIQPATLTSAAWDTAIATGAVRNISLKDATLISPYYLFYARYEKEYEMIGNQMTKVAYADINMKNLLTGIAGSVDKLLSIHNPVDGHGVPVPHFGVVQNFVQWHQLCEKVSGFIDEFVIAPCIRFAGEPGEQGTVFFVDPSGNALEFKAFKDITTQLFAK
jgi:extradiol dioxygenase family protein